MADIGTQTDSTTKLSGKDFPEKSLGRVFPSFESFRKELKTKLGEVILTIVKKVVEKDDGTKVQETDWAKSREGLTYKSSDFGLGILWEFVAKNFYFEYRNRKYATEQRDFIDEFTAELAFVVAEVRRKEHVWTQLCLNLEKWTKSDTTTTQKTSGSDKGGKTTSGDKANYQVMSKELTQKTDQYGKVSTFDQKSDTNITTHKGVNYAPLGKILSSLSNLQVDFSTFYHRLDCLFETYSAPTLEWVIDKTTGRRKWVTEEEYEEIMEPEKKEERKKKKLGLDAHDVLKEYFDTGNWEKYLEALTIYHEQNEKEYEKLPDTSNRKPRVAIRIKHGKNFLKAFKKEIKRSGDFKFITKEEFLARVGGEREGFPKIVGYEEIISQVADYLASWHFWQKWGGEKPQQLMIGLLGDPGLGKTYICQAIGKALGNGYYRISLNGKNSSSVIYGTSIDNPGAEMGRIATAISENKSQFTVVFFDEIEKAGKEAKDAIGEPTDRTGNSEFKDSLYDFITPCNNLMFFCALNYPEELPDFIRDRFTMIEVKPPSYSQRIEILRGLLMSSLKKFDEPFQGIYHQTWKQVYDVFNHEALLKKALTKTLSIRGAKDNIARLINRMRVDFLMPEKTLPSDVINHNWKFKPKEDLDDGDKRRGRPPCPYGEEKRREGNSIKEHRKSCRCFANNLHRVPGWKEKMGDAPDFS